MANRRTSGAAALLAFATGAAIKGWVPPELQPAARDAVLVGTEVMGELWARLSPELLERARRRRAARRPAGR